MKEQKLITKDAIPSPNILCKMLHKDNVIRHKLLHVDDLHELGDWEWMMSDAMCIQLEGDPTVMQDVLRGMAGNDDWDNSYQLLPNGRGRIVSFLKPE